MLLQKKLMNENGNRNLLVVYFICALLALSAGYDFFAAPVMVNSTTL
jgi:hypothetical protein